MIIKILQENNFKKVKYLKGTTNEYVSFMFEKKNHIIKLTGKYTKYFRYKGLRYDVVIEKG